MELNTLKKMRQNRKQYIRWIKVSVPKVKGEDEEGGGEEEELLIS